VACNPLINPTCGGTVVTTPVVPCDPATDPRCSSAAGGCDPSINPFCGEATIGCDPAIDPFCAKSINQRRSR
jgi:hypothetical protein